MWFVCCLCGVCFICVCVYCVCLVYVVVCVIGFVFNLLRGLGLVVLCGCKNMCLMFVWCVFGCLFWCVWCVCVVCVWL